MGKGSKGGGKTGREGMETERRKLSNGTRSSFGGGNRRPLRLKLLSIEIAEQTTVSAVLLSVVVKPSIVGGSTRRPLRRAYRRASRRTAPARPPPPTSGIAAVPLAGAERAPVHGAGRAERPIGRAGRGRAARRSSAGRVSRPGVQCGPDTRSHRPSSAHL